MQAEPQEGAGSDSDSEGEMDISDLTENIESLNLEYLEYCRERFEIGDLVEIGLGANDLPAVYLHHPNGAELEVYLHGANITSWRKPDGSDLLFVRPDNSFDGFEPIKGGIPVVFPQYGRGVLPTNGLLRRMHWSIAATGVADPDIAADPAPSVALWTESDEFTMEIWPHKFEAMYTVSLMDHDEFPDNSIPNPVPERVQSDGAQRGPGMNQIGQWSSPGGEAGGSFEGEEVDDDPLQLRCVLEIANTDDKEFTFTSGLQTHFAVRPLGEYPQSSQLVKILGLGGKHVLDYSGDPSHPRLIQQDADYVHFGERPVDSVFVDTDKTDVKLCPGDRTHHEIINRSGFRDTGAINPHMRMPDAYRHFVAVPSARVARPVTLQPGETWVGEMVIRSFDSPWERPLFEFDHEQARTNEAPPLMENMQPPNQWR